MHWYQLSLIGFDVSKFQTQCSIDMLIQMFIKNKFGKILCEALKPKVLSITLHLNTSNSYSIWNIEIKFSTVHVLFERRSKTIFLQIGRLVSIEWNLFIE